MDSVDVFVLRSPQFETVVELVPVLPDLDRLVDPEVEREKSRVARVEIPTRDQARDGIGGGVLDSECQTIS